MRNTIVISLAVMMLGFLFFITPPKKAEDNRRTMFVKREQVNLTSDDHPVQSAWLATLAEDADQDPQRAFLLVCRGGNCIVDILPYGYWYAEETE